MIGPALLALACASAQAAPARVSFKTADGWTIVATYRAPQKGRPTAVMVHGAAAGRGEWEPLAAALASRGWGALALDLRGHGDSVQGPRGRSDFAPFDQSGEWPRAESDIVGAASWLESRGVTPRSIVLIGASIGANLCSRAFAALPQARALVMLSPGADYRGVTLARFKAARAVAAASPPDGYAYATVKRLKQLLPGLTVLESRSGHGAQMFSDEEFMGRLISALELAAGRP